MKALTLQNPWAWAVFQPQGKKVENRSWKTSYRGDLLIHAGKSRHSLPSCRWIDEMTLLDTTEVEFEFGVILGVVELVDIVTNSDSIWALPDCYHWVFNNPRQLTSPLPARGMTYIWTPTSVVKSAFDRQRDRGGLTSIPCRE